MADKFVSIRYAQTFNAKRWDEAMKEVCTKENRALSDLASFDLGSPRHTMVHQM